MVGKRDRRGPLVVLLTDDVWRKLAAILLAMLLWLYLDQLVTRDTTMTLDLTPVPLDAAPGDIGSRQLGIALDLDRYAVVAFRNPTQPDADNVPVEVDQVDLQLRGSARLLRDLPDSVAFRATPIVETGPRGPMATLGLADLRPVDERLVFTPVSLSPPQILIELTPIAAETIVLAPPMLDLTGIGPDLEQRLRLDEARFEPATVTIRGPATALDALTRETGSIFGLTGVAQDGQGLRASLALRDVPPGVQLDGIPTVRIPLGTPARFFDLPGVPVILHSVEGLARRFRPTDPTQDVRISASGQLENRLSGMSPEQLRSWVRDNALIIGRLPHDADGADVIYWSEAFLVLGRAARDDQDFRVVDTLTIHYEPIDR